MSLKNTQLVYGSVAKIFHWLIAVLLIAMIIYGFFLDYIPKDYSPIAYNVHKLMGLTLLFLMLLRLGWSLINVKPLLKVAVWETVLERIVHYSLYMLVILMPLAGWVGSSASGRPPHIGDWQLMLPIAENKALAQTAFELHNTVAWYLVVFISLHVLAALYHQFVRRDDVLKRMWP